MAYLALYATAHTADWTAHVLEQLADNRLIRPVAFTTTRTISGSNRSVNVEPSA
ncbi:MAG: hypothetical protein GY762_14245 [Proteobacteria bacterium]|nr:hypothetical protein [Pseudomonadota bacterium]